MVTITLPPELEKGITERARKQGTTPELWTLDRLHKALQNEAVLEGAREPVSEGGSMLDFFEGYIGMLHSSEFVPSGAQMSQDTGRKFAESMHKRQQEDKL